MIEYLSFFLRKKYIKYLTSNFIYTIVPFLIIPLITRIYSPQDLASYSIILGASIILSRFSTLGLHNIILIEKKTDEISIFVLLPIFATLIINLFFFLLILNFNWLFDYYESGKYFYFIPLISLIYSIYLIFKTSLIRFGDFIPIAKARLIFSISLPILALVFGLLNFKIVGLFVSIALTNLLSILYLIKHTKRYLFNIKKVAKKVFYISFYFRKYASYIMWINPSNLINILSNYLLIILISRFYGSVQAGIFIFSINFLEVPLGLITSPIQDIFTQSATSEIDNNGNAKLSFKKTFALLVLISIIAIIPISLYFSRYIPLIFGNQWEDSVDIIKAIFFIVSIRFISSPLSMIWIIRKKERLNFIWQLILILLICGTVTLPFYFYGNNSIISTLSIYSYGVGTWYAVAILISYKLANWKLKNKL